jgi:hypothetical protein
MVIRIQFQFHFPKENLYNCGNVSHLQLIVNIYTVGDIKGNQSSMHSIPSKYGVCYRIVYLLD